MSAQLPASRNQSRHYINDEVLETVKKVIPV